MAGSKAGKRRRRRLSNSLLWSSAALMGWRKSETTGLHWRNVDRSGAVIRLEPMQNKGRAVRLTAFV